MAPSSPPISRQQLENILGLDSETSKSEFMRSALRLLTRLERRRDQAEGDERLALDREIEDVMASLVVWAESDAALGAEAAAEQADGAIGASRASMAEFSSAIARERLFLGVIVILAVVVVGLIATRLAEHAARSADDPRIEIEPARLIVESRPSDGTLRIRQPNSEELLVKLPAGGAVVDLEPGRYAIDVSREDCPDVWALEIELEEAETRRYEPTICTGTGELVVRSNVNGDRLRIDELDLGATRVEPHLLGVGDHRIVVEKSGYAPFEGQVRILPNEKVELRAELVAASGDAPGGGPRTGQGKGAEQAPPKPALPFDVVRPTRPPSSEGVRAKTNAAARPDRPSGVGGATATERREARRLTNRQALVPEPIEPEPIELVRPELDFDVSKGFQAVPKGGSTTWHDAMSRRFLKGFDVDRSGRIDRIEETQAIPCSFWKSIERSFDEANLGLSMSRLYGFDGSEWHPKALGFAREQRGLAYEQMKGCGLAP